MHHKICSMCDIAGLTLQQELLAFALADFDGKTGIFHVTLRATSAFNSLAKATEKPIVVFVSLGPRLHASLRAVRAGESIFARGSLA